MKSFKNIICTAAILATVAMSGMMPNNAETKQEQIPSVDLNYLLWHKNEPESSFYGPNALARAKDAAYAINARFHNAIEIQKKRDIFSDFGKVANSLNRYDLELIQNCARFSKMRLKYGINDGAEPFYGNACQFPIPDELGGRNLYSGFGSYEHQILWNAYLDKSKALK